MVYFKGPWNWCFNNNKNINIMFILIDVQLILIKSSIIIPKWNCFKIELVIIPSRFFSLSINIYCSPLDILWIKTNLTFNILFKSIKSLISSILSIILLLTITAIPSTPWVASPVEISSKSKLVFPYSFATIQWLTKH